MLACRSKEPQCRVTMLRTRGAELPDGFERGRLALCGSILKGWWHSAQGLRGTSYPGTSVPPRPQP